MRLAFVAALVAPLALLGQNPPGLTAVLSAPGGQTTFYQGEAIHLTLSVTSASANRYSFINGHVERSCVPPWDKFSITPAQGWSDPLKQYYSGDTCAFSMLSSESWLSTHPTTMDLPLHEWVRFDRPGKYIVKVATERVRQPQRLYDPNSPRVPLVSEELELTIIPADQAWQDAILRQAQVMLVASTPAQWNTASRAPATAAKAIEMLGALGTPDAARELAQWAGNAAAQGSWEQAMAETGQVGVGVEALQALMVDPNHAVTADFLRGLTQLLLNARGLVGGRRRARRKKPPRKRRLLKK